MTESPGNAKSNRSRVSDLVPPPAPQRAQTHANQPPAEKQPPVKQPPSNTPPAKSRSDLPTVRSVVPAPHFSIATVPAPKTAVPQMTVPPAVAPSRQEYQRSLSELLYRPHSYWTLRDSWQNAIGSKILDSSKSMETRNFQRIAKQDLERMAEAYDQQFFGGLCLPLARSYGLSFRLSSRMTRAGGKTTRTVFRGTRSKPSRTHYEIALSTSLLFQSFRKKGDTIRVCGYECNDRLTAMQRIVEHEMIHLCEMLAWIQSDCSAGRFQSIARNMFGHTEHRHELITQQERAATEFNIRAGVRVAFPFEGTVLQGVVNRITRRATILVEDLRGLRYSNGKRYLKYYVPIHQLRPID